MKILAIRLKNLASMEGATEIDFTQEPLCSAGIFAITGPTGAGKSTILDALCLALYAKTPRYAQGKEAGIEVKELNQGDVRAILRNGAGDGFAEVDFVGIDEHKYRSTWSVKRARNKPEGAIQKDTLTIKNIDSGIVISGIKTEASREIERLVGLSFDQFTRSVLLAQGDFTAFLKADNNDKASLLEKLTGTSIYSKISQQVFNNYKAAQSYIDQLKALLDVVEILSEDQIQSENARQEEINVTIGEIHTQVEVLNHEIHWQEKMLQLNQQRELALALLDTARQRKQDAADRFERLKLIEEAQKIRSTYDLHQSIIAQYANDKENFDAATTALAASQSSLSEIEVSFSSISSILTAAIEKRTKSLPGLIEARRLDVQLTEQYKNVLSCKKVFDEATEKSEEKQSRLKEANTKLQILNNDIKLLQDWRQRNIDREPVATNIVLIRTRLEEASRLLTAEQDVFNIQEIKQQEANRTEEIINRLSGDFESANVEFCRLNTELKDLQTKLDDFNISSLEENSTEFGLLLQRLIPASAAWKMLYEKQRILKEITKSIQELTAQQDDAENRLQSIEQLLPVSFDKKNASNQRLARARLKVSENVELLRTQLQDGEACPVCGSIEHPFATHHPQVAGILNLLEREADSDFKEWTALVNEKQVLTESRKRLIDDLNRSKANLNDTSLHVKQLDCEWKAFAIELPTLSELEIDHWLDSKIRKCQFDQQQANQKISEYVMLDHKRKSKESQLTDIEKKQVAITNELRIESTNLESYRKRITELTTELQHKKSECSILVNGLNIYFNQATWYAHWKDAPALFIQKLQQFVTEWNNNLSQLDGNERNKELIENSKLELTRQVQEQLAEVQNRQQEYDSSIDVYKNIELKRTMIFEGKPANDVEKALQDDIDRASKELDNAKTSRQLFNEKIAVSNSLIGQLSLSMNTKEKTATELMQKLNQWINRYNASTIHTITFDQLEEALSHSHEWIETEQVNLNAIARAIIEAESSLRVHESEIQNHTDLGKPSSELEVLTAARDKLRAEKKIHEESLMHIRFKLDADRSNKVKAGKIITDIELASSKADNWAKLNEMIGSADGKKFRQAAQEYTLDVLLVFANAQLTALNKRYELRRIENTLGLLVVDKDMGDEERTVVSLSGGESFLASLALALGLASLSSSRMKVESLFIDEGFGSLDPATLNIAMDALEKLHNQGRKVGVISHVREMQERITTQIRVVKQSTGRSIITIENGLN